MKLLLWYSAPWLTCVCFMGLPKQMNTDQDTIKVIARQTWYKPSRQKQTKRWKQSPYAGTGLSLICFNFKPGSSKHTWHNSTRMTANHQYIDLLINLYTQMRLFPWFSCFLVRKLHFPVHGLYMHSYTHLLNKSIVNTVKLGWETAKALTLHPGVIFSCAYN